MTATRFIDGVEFRPVVRRGEIIPGYLVGADGSVLSRMERDYSARRIAWRMGEGYHRLRPGKSGKRLAYSAVMLRHAGRSITVTVHLLVAEAFLGPCPDGMEVCHEDGNGHNNRLDNLRYDTPVNNEADKVRHGTHQFGQQNPAAKLTDAQADELRRLRAGGAKLKDIAAKFGVRESTVSRIANGIRRAR